MKFFPTLLLFIFASSTLITIPNLSLAQSHYPGQHQGKFKIQDSAAPIVSSFDLSAVKLLDSRFKENMSREEKWLLSIDNKRLLHSFYTNAGLWDANEGGYFDLEKLGGWESLDCDLRGHSMGHILSGLALLYASTDNIKYKLKADSLIKGLGEVQKALNQQGYLSAFPQELINRNIQGQRVWAPWYTLHKIFSGLIDQYLYCDNIQALDIAKGMSSWAYNKLKPLTAENRTKMLKNEFGGINESFFNLYAITANPKDKWLADFFYHNEVLDPLKEKKDILEKKHANTYIPKLIGIARDYEIEGKQELHEVADFFWNTVVDHHSFATGSNSDKEKFFAADHLSEHLTGYTGESCNVYNMLKLTKHLYAQSGDIKYIEFYEKALYNHILGQQDPKTGMISYFLPMMSGAHKVYSTPFNSFWCCVGSGFENQAKYGENIYSFHNNDAIVNLFIPSVLEWKEKDFRLTQTTEFPKNGLIRLSIDKAPKTSLNLKIRFPSWALSGSSLKINGKPWKLTGKAGSYITIERVWKAGDIIDLNYVMGLSIIPANDNNKKAAFAYGPIVLAGELGTAGFSQTAPYSNPKLYNDYYTYDYRIPSDINDTVSIDVNNIGKYVERTKNDSLDFKIKTNNITLRPLYDVHRQRYAVYWNIIKP